MALSYDTYLTPAEVDEILSVDGVDRRELWDNLGSDTLKNILLARASLMVDGSMRFIDKKLEKAQPLKFPRTGMTEIPLAVKMATVEVVLGVLSNEMMNGVTLEKIGKLTWEYSEAQGKLGETVANILNPFKSHTVPFKVGN